MIHPETSSSYEMFQPGASAHAAFERLASLGREIPNNPGEYAMWEMSIMADTGELSTPLDYAVLYRKEVVGSQGGLWVYLRVDVGRQTGWPPLLVRRSPTYQAVKRPDGYEDNPETNEDFLERLRFVWDHRSGSLPPSAWG